MSNIVNVHRQEYAQADDVKISIGYAPGRINFLGDNGQSGKRFLLSATVSRGIEVAVSPREDGLFRFFSADLDERKRVSFANLKPRREDRWSNHVKLALQFFIEGEKVDCKGLSFTILGDIPQSSGFGSSSALELASAIALRAYFKPSMTDDTLLSKLIASHAEYYEQKPADNIDFFIMLKAKPGNFQIVNEEKCTIHYIKNPFQGYKMFIFDSRVPRLTADNEMRRRDSQLARGLSFITQKKPSVTLADPRAVDMIEADESMTEEVRRRCLYVAHEIERLNQIENLFLEKDFSAALKLFLHSQEDLRDLFEVSCPEVDWLVKRACETHGVAASRMTGFAFAPCTFLIANDEGEAAFRAKLDDYERIFGFHPIDYEISIAGPARAVRT